MRFLRSQPKQVDRSKFCRELFSGWAFVAALALGGFLTVSAPAITVGPGSSIGTDSAGNAFNEEFQDWTASDLRALDPIGTADGLYNYSDGYDQSRDLMAFYSHIDSAQNGNAYFRLDFYNLALGAESGYQDFYIAIDTGSTTVTQRNWMPDNTNVQVSESNSGQTGGWMICLAMYDTQYWKIYDGDWTVLAERYAGGSPTGTYASHFVGYNNAPYYHSQLDAVELGISKQMLYDKGWNGTTPLKFWVMTTKDSSSTSCGSGSKATDTFKDSDRGCSDGIINGAILSSDTTGRAKYASIAHANQSINKNDDVRIHIFDSAFNTGFVRTLDTHEIFKVPLNMHLSGCLLSACAWAKAQTGSSDKSDGPTFITRIKDLADSGVTANPSAFIGGVMAEHIMPYFEGTVNRTSMDLFEEVSKALLGKGAADMKVMHVPERVIRSYSTGMSVLNGFTFADIAATTYTATVLDEVTHYHHWFDSGNSTWSGNGGSGDAPNQHKIQKINGVYCFLINDREDQQKFGNDDGGATLDSRYTLIDKAIQSDQAQITVVFDDWEALAGKSFNIDTGSPVANNNMEQYQRTIRWLANHPWVEIVRLNEVLDRATNVGNSQYNPAYVVDRGTQTNLSMQTYEYLKWSSELGYDFWYYNNFNSNTGNEQSFYDLVPVITGNQGDYTTGQRSTIQGYAAGTARDNQAATYDGPKITSNKKNGDLNTSNTLIQDAYVDLATAPNNNLRKLGWYQYANMIYETAWHQEQGPITYANTVYQSPNFPSPDTTWDGMNTWALRLGNHIRDAGFLAYAARWANAVQTGSQTATAQALAIDLDQDGQNEYVLRNNKVLAIFEKWGGRMIYAFHYHPTAGPICDIGAPTANPSGPGEEEYTGTSANRCSALKDMNNGTYADQAYNVAVGTNSLTLSSTSGSSIVKTVTLNNGESRLLVSYNESVSGDLYIQVGASPNNLDIIKNGRTHLSTQSNAGYYRVANSVGGDVYVTLGGGVSRNATPLNAGYDNRNLAHTEIVEIYGNGTFSFSIAFEAAAVPVETSLFELE
ncbi:MAG: hypothetical protein K1X53_01885 [Candidatus Sumerlaeaceae bacterium]|nr:hypothetical protein [Candidatus Sumerlaeaceae bacterium]